MKKIKTILVPTDFSVPAEYALEYAIQLAKILEASVILYHAFIPFESGFYPPAQRKKGNDETERNLLRQLSKMAEKIRSQDDSISVSVELDRGPEHIRLLDYCKQTNVDLIVMGTKGASGLKEVTIGSFTAEIMTQSTCPVLAIPGDTVFRHPEKLMYASGYEAKEGPALVFLNDFTNEFSAELCVLHVWDDEYSEERKEEIRSAYKTLIDQHFTHKTPQLLEVDSENIIESILALATNNETDILAISPIKREGIWNWIFRKNFVKSTAHKITIPLLTIPI
ncbi:universal stress protein [Arundinibacter roseus]|uniref:Universal stress protein n=1 Tax=Arundinibacter roseus TaxID=2070510 RepID=A0A4V2XAK5_9BACT|nr:universal stress protein [Arundinibacter roseus]TDB68035.1 universal stress protein [Arundinibacter roseus]